MLKPTSACPSSSLTFTHTAIAQVCTPGLVTEHTPSVSTTHRKARPAAHHVGSSPPGTDGCCAGAVAAALGVWGTLPASQQRCLRGLYCRTDSVRRQVSSPEEKGEDKHDLCMLIQGIHTFLHDRQSTTLTQLASTQTGLPQLHQGFLLRRSCCLRVSHGAHRKDLMRPFP